MGSFNKDSHVAFASCFPRPNHSCAVGVASSLQQGKTRHHRLKSLAQDDTVNLQQPCNKAQELTDNDRNCQRVIFSLLHSLMKDNTLQSCSCEIVSLNFLPVNCLLKQTLTAVVLFLSSLPVLFSCKCQLQGIVIERVEGKI